MRIRILILLLALGCASVWLPAQGPSKPASHPAGNAKLGKTLFVGHCSACHGIDGRGGEAPNIATNPTVQAFSDSHIETIVTGGLPGGMPSFGSQLSATQIHDIVAYLRVLQGVSGTSGSAAPAASASELAAGKALFFGKAGCSECHMVAGQGGFIGPDLSGSGLNANSIRKAILQPSSFGPGATWTTVRLKDGQTLTGVARNEDNFSIQLQDRSGAFHLLNKADVASLTRSKQPIMPSDYGNRLTANQLDNLVSFLAAQSGPPHPHRFR